MKVVDLLEKKDRIKNMKGSGGRIKKRNAAN